MRLPSSLLALLLAILSPTNAAADSASNNASLLWGPYRPNLYMGIRPRMPDSLIAGLMWGKVEEMESSTLVNPVREAQLTSVTELRHEVDVGAGMAKYGWTAYDTREGGTQTIEGNWALRIRGTPRKDAPADIKTSVVFYVGMESMEACPKCKLVASEQLGPEEDTSIHAANLWIEHPQLGTAGLHIPASVGESGRHEAMVVKSLNVSDDKLWQARCKRNSIEHHENLPSICERSV
jgi:mannosyl-oligosaccharide glucosidase